LIAGHALSLEKKPNETDYVSPIRELILKHCGVEVQKLEKEGKCGQPHPGYLLKCLKQNPEEISSPDCKNLVGKKPGEIRGNITHAHPHLGIRRHCANEAKTFCQDVPREFGKKVECLKLHMNEKGFSNECAQTLHEKLLHQTRTEKA